jgi:hypothetical protein
MPRRPFSKLKKHGPTNLYMIYPMAQSVALVCVEIDKKMPLQWHCPLSSLPSKSKIILARGPAPTKIGMRLGRSPRAFAHLRVSLLAQPTTPQRAKKKPYRHGTGAPRDYPHTLITVKLTRF